MLRIEGITLLIRMFMYVKGIKVIWNCHISNIFFTLKAKLSLEKGF